MIATQQSRSKACVVEGRRNSTKLDFPPPEPHDHVIHVQTSLILTYFAQLSPVLYAPSRLRRLTYFLMDSFNHVLLQLHLAATPSNLGPSLATLQQLGQATRHSCSPGPVPFA